MDFVRRRKKSGDVRLFHQIKYGDFDNRYRHFGEWFMRYMERIKVKNQHCNVVFHSFRHTFRDELLNNGVNEEMRRALGGWADDDRSTELQYGKGFNLAKKYAAIKKLRYEGLDLSHLYRDK